MCARHLHDSYNLWDLRTTLWVMSRLSDNIFCDIIHIVREIRLQPYESSTVRGTVMSFITFTYNSLWVITFCHHHMTWCDVTWCSHFYTVRDIYVQLYESCTVWDLIHCDFCIKLYESYTVSKTGIKSVRFTYNTKRHHAYSWHV